MTASSFSTLKLEHPAQAMYTDFFLKYSPQYTKLHKIRQQGSNNPDVDEYYKLKCALTKHKLWEMPDDNSCKQGQDPYLKMRCEMSEELDQERKILSILEETPQPSVLETGMAVGGFSQHVLGRYPHARITGISIPGEEGGCPVGFESDNVDSVLKNVGTLAGDVGVSDIPETHQMETSLTMERVLPAGEEYDLIFCQEQPTASSFYLVAKKVQTRSENAAVAIETWRQKWKNTLGEAAAADGSAEPVDEEVQAVSELLEDRGKLLIELAAPVWEAQADGLESLFRSVAKESKQSPPSKCLHAKKLARKLNPNWNPFSALKVDY
ncbi:hypothetical protein E5D57_006932 [Metarhizium anisopliae]|nr:hypothetical protein E5D57_006932 [Metarhizium anisopliae]